MSKKLRFKVGDIVTPLPGKKMSRSYDITKLQKAKVIQVPDYSYSPCYLNDNGWHAKTAMRIQPIKGKLIPKHGGYNSSPANNNIVFQDSFALCNHDVDSISIFSSEIF